MLMVRMFDSISHYSGRQKARAALPSNVRWPRFLASLAFVTPALLGPSLCRGGQFQVEHDVAYLGEGRQEKSDLYLPNSDSTDLRPGMVVIHGGGWTAGDKGKARERNICSLLAGQGYVCLSINYRLQQKEAPSAWPQNLYDCKTAVRWLRANADRLKLDASRMGVIGGSAGGHLALIVGVTGPESGLDPATPLADYSCRVQAVVDLYGPILDTPRRPRSYLNFPEQDEKLYRQVTPLSHLDKDDPPVLIIHGTGDTSVSISESQRLARALETAGVIHKLVIVEDAPHSFHLQPKQQDLRPIVFDFLDRYLRP